MPRANLGGGGHWMGHLVRTRAPQWLPALL
nr:MAG TPA_asm: hypothetical protein [Caudoviricetes sp.]